MLTSSTVIADITQARLEFRGCVAAWLVGHSHDQDLLDEKSLSLMFVLELIKQGLILWSLLLYLTSRDIYKLNLFRTSNNKFQVKQSLEGKSYQMVEGWWNWQKRLLDDRLRPEATWVFITDQSRWLMWWLLALSLFYCAAIFPALNTPTPQYCYKPKLHCKILS